MYKLDFRHPCHIHFIGIGGISMSGFAKLLHHAGFTVSGSDGRRSPLTDELAAEGVKVSIGQRASNITEDIDVVVYTAAIGHDNPEFVEATILGLPMMDRAEMVGQVMKNYAESVAVAGTHGKTTTTSMLSHIMIEGEKDPTISVGGILPAHRPHRFLPDRGLRVYQQLLKVRSQDLRHFKCRRGPSGLL